MTTIRIARSVALTLVAVLACGGLVRADAHTEQAEGHVRNERGEPCRYGQRYEDANHFHEDGFVGHQGVLRFDDPDCMRGGALGLDANEQAINDVVVSWYSLWNANFLTRASELRGGSQLQTRGLCIQSGTYSAQGIVIDYVVEDDSIVEVRHGSALGGCR